MPNVKGIFGKRWGSALAALAIPIAAAGGAYAATSSGGRTISACVQHHGGLLYKARHCRGRDHRLRWNVRGPQGTQGAKGDRGVAGPAGSAVAYAEVSSHAVLNAARSKNVLGIAQACQATSSDCSVKADDYICFHLGVSVRNAVVTYDGDQPSATPFTAVTLNPGTAAGEGPWCPPGFTDAQVHAAGSDMAGAVVGGFFVAFN